MSCSRGSMAAPTATASFPNLHPASRNCSPGRLRAYRRICSSRSAGRASRDLRPDPAPEQDLLRVEQVDKVGNAEAEDRGDVVEYSTGSGPVAGLGRGQELSQVGLLVSPVGPTSGSALPTDPRHRRKIASPPTWAWRQPYSPHWHGRSPHEILVWPNSPALPDAPRRSLPAGTNTNADAVTNKNNDPVPALPRRAQPHFGGR